MYLERLSVKGVDSNDNPNKYFAPGGTFNTSYKNADVNLPNCTMYCLCRGYEAMEATERFPWVRSSGGFGSAKTWYDTTILPKGSKLTTGSVAVFDGNYGHVVFIERVIDSTHALISESNYDPDKTRRDWMYWRCRVVELIPGRATLSGVGALKGFIYLPINKIDVNENLKVDQLEVKGEYINVRKSPAGEKHTGLFCPLGFYNVLEIAEAGGYTWYKLGDEYWVAEIPDESIYHKASEQQIDENDDGDTIMSWVKPEPVKENSAVDQIFINNNSGVIRIRRDHSTKSEVMGSCINKAYYNTVDKFEGDDYTWYSIGEESWVAGIEEVEFRQASVWHEPIPVEEDPTKDQVFINNNSGLIRIRKEASLSGKVMGYVENKAYYDVFGTFKSGGYTWYNLGVDSYIAGIEEVEYHKGQVEPTPVDPWEPPVSVERDKKKNQIYVRASGINIRKEPTTKSDIMGQCEFKVYYDVIQSSKKSDYTWYNVCEDGWVAGVPGIDFLEVSNLPTPVEDDETKDQLFVGDVTLNIRNDCSSKAEKIGVCESNSTYDVIDIEAKSDYTWYKLEEGAWVAGVEEVIYYPAGSSRKGPALKALLPSLKSSLDIALKCVDKNSCSEFYDELYDKANELNDFINENFDSFEYDLVDEKEYDEIDVLYTADVHGAWVGYDEDGNYLSPVFNYNDVSNYRSKLKKNNIKALLVDCGDWSRPCRVYDDYWATGEMKSAIEMNSKEYFLSTFGNHEWRWQVGEGVPTEGILNKSNSITACNLFKNGKLVYKPYRTAKIGSKRIGIIGVGYPSANGNGSYDNGVWTYDNYTFYDDHKLFTQVQKYIDELKAANFDYIIVATHMCKSTYESDNRYIARTDSLIKNTKGLTAVLQGHYNFATTAETMTDKAGKPVLLAHEAGANMNSFGRLQLRTNRVSSYLLDERSDLNVI